MDTYKLNLESFLGWTRLSKIKYRFCKRLSPQGTSKVTSSVLDELKVSEEQPNKLFFIDEFDIDCIRPNFSRPNEELSRENLNFFLSGMPSTRLGMPALLGEEEEEEKEESPKHRRNEKGRKFIKRRDHSRQDTAKDRDQTRRAERARKQALTTYA